MKECHKAIFDLAIRTADMLVKMFGSRCEVAVHNFDNLEQSLIHLAGSITDRKIGSPITDLVLQELNKPITEINDMPNYKTQSKNGIVMKSSTVFLRDADDHIIGALCMNYDISLLMQLEGEVGNFITFDEEQSKSENFFSSVHDVIQGMAEQVLQGFKKAPSVMSMDEKVECVRQLEQRGTFLIKGATEYVATILGVSKFTIYNYLQKIRTHNEYHIEEEVKEK
ncbi:PAS domain-containing protein [Fodinisporobacter ferrooxydans]|uniref:PAS domain-containing protein n=1 Tax=Fodinisporobacter ferrooxydans TaxID=2901836 RepID=A0ABY4CG47_9BACL|nr:PAS domain-containing protein [Alicyclobacillaceae bacterium MYW30-H2]